MTDITSTETEVAETDTAEHADESHGPSDALFIQVFVVLALITGLEVVVSYLDIGPFFLPVLLGLMIIKFFTVVLIFMHVKYDDKIFGRLFYIGLAGAMVLYLAVLATFRFFGS